MNGTTRRLALTGIAMILSTCTALEAQRSGTAGEREPQAAATQETGNGAEPARLGNVTAAEAEARAEQDRADREAQRRQLIDDINRDGQPARVDGYREAPPLPVELPANNVVELNYEQADLREILADMADALDISMVIDPTISEQVSIRTAQERPLRYEDIWPLLRLLTDAAGVALERIGDVYYARQSEVSLPMEISMPDGVGDGPASRIMQITPLTYITAASALELLTPLIAPEGQVLRVGNNNTLAIVANRSRLARVNELLTLIDDDPFRTQGIRLYELSNATAADVGAELTDIINMVEGDSPAYQVQALERINALLVTAPASRGFNEITRWVRLLDDADQQQQEQLFQYRVRNLNATELAATLTEVFRRDEAAEEDEERVMREDDAEQRQRELRSAAREALGLAAGDLADAPPAGSVEAGVMVTEVAVSADLRVNIVADDATNSLLIRANPRDYRQLLSTINQLDAVPLQVMINAAIAQITLTDDTAFGVDWSRVAENMGSGSSRVSTSFLPPRGEDGSGGLGGLLFNRTFLDGAARIDATLEAIATNNEVRLLARPSITVVNNMEGEIQIGSQVPVRLGETATNVGVTSNVQYRDVGIELFITPRINDDGVVNLTIRQSLSSLSENSGVDGNPIFQNQDIETTVVARNGENVVLGGLIQDNNDNLNTGVPGLNRIPVLGGLFSFRRNNNERQELFIVLRPEIINLNERGGDRYQQVRSRFERVASMLDDTGF